MEAEALPIGDTDYCHASGIAMGLFVSAVKIKEKETGGEY